MLDGQRAQPGGDVAPAPVLLATPAPEPGGPANRFLGVDPGGAAGGAWSGVLPAGTGRPVL